MCVNLPETEKENRPLVGSGKLVKKTFKSNESNKMSLHLEDEKET